MSEQTWYDDGYLDRLEVLANHATPAPWVARCKDTDHWFRITGAASDFDGGDWMVCPPVAIVDRGNEDDAAFIEAARDAVPLLIARVRELERRLGMQDGGGES